MYAKYAEMFFKDMKQEKEKYAQENVGRNIEEIPGKTMLKKNVLSAIINLFQINLKRLKRAQIIAEPYLDIPTEAKIKKIIFEEIEEMTYNLHVDNYNNFSVNGGLVVHNSIKAPGNDKEQNPLIDSTDVLEKGQSAK